jgi:hypothetical protein
MNDACLCGLFDLLQKEQQFEVGSSGLAFLTIAAFLDASTVMLTVLLLEIIQPRALPVA